MKGRFSCTLLGAAGSVVGLSVALKGSDSIRLGICPILPRKPLNPQVIGRYIAGTAGRNGPFRVDVELRYQPISFRWAQNLRPYDAPETKRFVSWYDAMSNGSSEVLAMATQLFP